MTDENIEKKENVLPLAPPPKEEIDYKDKYFRSIAEMENMRKRMQKEKEEIISYTIENTIEKFLPVLENFENALQYADKASDEVQKWSIGFHMILSQFQEILHTYGIVAYHSKGNLFDPHFHEAIEVLETNDFPEGTILGEFSKGYERAGHIIRPARVKIAKKSIKGSTPDEHSADPKIELLQEDTNHEST
ncbi:MAG: nucleotide exchange factor GrpE [Chlamydiota bacterium]